MDTSVLLAKGFATRDFEKFDGKLKYTLKSITVADKLYFLGAEDQDSLTAYLAGSLVKYGDKSFSSPSEAYAFISDIDPNIAVLIKKDLDTLNGEVEAHLNKWAEGVVVKMPDSEDILNLLVSGKKLVAEVQDPSSSFNAQVKTLSLSEESAAAAGKSVPDMSQKEYIEFLCEILSYSLASINGRKFTNSGEVLSGLRSMPERMLWILFGWFNDTAKASRKVLEENKNF